MVWKTLNAERLSLENKNFKIPSTTQLGGKCDQLQKQMIHMAGFRLTGAREEICNVN